MDESSLKEVEADSDAEYIDIEYRDSRVRCIKDVREPGS